MTLKKNILISFVIALVSSLFVVMLSYLLYRIIFESIGCDCGSEVEFQGVTIQSMCGCANQFSFSRMAEPIILIAPFITFVIVYIISFIVLKSQKKR